MSRREPKAGEWIRQQIEELGALRNASVRDPQFKAWRQNTLTYIQRIWEGDTTRSERFRRIPFSPNSTRADARAIREQFERGCGEALEYLNSLLDTLGEEKVAHGTTRSVSRDPAREADDPPADDAGDDEAEIEEERPTIEPVLEGDGPILDLPPAAPRSTGPSRLPTSAMRPVAPEGLPDDYAGATPLDRPTQPSRPAPPRERPAAPASPAASPGASPAAEESRISVRGTPARSTPPSAPNPLRDILKPPAAAPGAKAKNGRAKKPARPRLKDMLGLSSLESEAPATPTGPARQTPAPPAARTPAPPAADAPASGAQAPFGPKKAPPTEFHEWSPEEFAQQTEAPAPLTADDVEPARGDTAASGTRGPRKPAETPADRKEPVGTPDNPPGAGDESWATQEFLRTSPVLSSTPRPVQRRAVPEAPGVTELPSRDSAASRMLAIAAEVDALGIPAGQRAQVRAALMDLARQLDEQELSWTVLRDAVTFVMDFPPIARRALPLLLPFFDIAA